MLLSECNQKHYNKKQNDMEVFIMKIAVVCANGKAGQLITKEALEVDLM